MNKEVLIDIFLWSSEEPRIVLTKEIGAYHERFLLFDKFLIWKKKRKKDEN